MNCSDFIRAEGAQAKGSRATPILGQRGHCFWEPAQKYTGQGHDFWNPARKGTGQGHVILVVFCCALGPWRNCFFFFPPIILTFFSVFLKAVAAILFQTNFRPKIWQSCTIGSSLMCSASHCIYGFLEIYFYDFWLFWFLNHPIAPMTWWSVKWIAPFARLLNLNDCNVWVYPPVPWLSHRVVG